MEVWAKLTIDWGEVISRRRYRGSLTFHPQEPGDVVAIPATTIKDDDKNVLIERATLLAKQQGAIAFEIVDETLPT